MTTLRSLLALPNELLALLIESDDLTVEDLANLRLTCKHTKHFASSTLGKRIFANLTIYCEKNAFRWFTNFLLLDRGSHIRSICLIGMWYSSKCIPLKHNIYQEAEMKVECPQLQNVTIEHCHGPAHLWKKVLGAANHLQTFKLWDRSAGTGPTWFGVYDHKFDKNDMLLSSIKSNCLRDLTLTYLHVSAGILKQLLDSHKETLLKLDIRGCILVDGNWFEILNCIRLELSHLHDFCIDVRYEAVKKVSPPRPYSYGHRPLGWSSYLENSPYDVKTYSSPLKLKLEEQKEISKGLSEFLKAREGHQAQ